MVFTSTTGADWVVRLCPPAAEPMRTGTMDTRPPIQHPSHPWWSKTSRENPRCPPLLQPNRGPHSPERAGLLDISLNLKNPSKRTYKNALHLIGYAKKYPNAQLLNEACDMILCIQSDASHHRLPGARSVLTPWRNQWYCRYNMQTNLRISMRLCNRIGIRGTIHQWSSRMFLSQ